MTEFADHRVFLSGGSLFGYFLATQKVTVGLEKEKRCFPCNCHSGLRAGI